MRKVIRNKKVKEATKIIIKTMVVIGIMVVIDTALAGISNADIKNASKTWVATLNDWSPIIVGSGFVLSAIMFFLNKYNYAIGVIGGTAFTYAAKSYMGTGEGALIDMARILFG